MAVVILLVFVLAFLFFLAGLWLLTRFRWIMGFLAGSFGILLLASAAMGALAAWRLSEYERVDGTTLLGTITVRDVAPQRYTVTLAQGRVASRYELSGERWRAVGQQVRVPEWLVFGAPMEFVTVLYIEGRYVRLEDELRVQREAQGPSWVRRLGDDVLAALFDTQTLYTPLLPLTVQALFSIEYNGERLVLQGINEPAQDALRR